MACMRHAHLPTRSLTARWLALLVGLVGVSVAGLLCQALWRQERSRIVDIVALETANIRVDLIQLLNDNIQALERMANRWVLRGGTPQAEWEADVATYVRHHPEARAFAWVDPSSHIRWIAPLVGNEAALGRDLTVEKWRRQALERARQQQTISLTHTVELAQGGAGILVYAPLFVNERFDGFLLGELRLQELLAPIAEAANAAGYALALFEGTQEVYAHIGHGRQLEARWTQELAMDLPGQGPRWRLRVWPSAEELTRIRSGLPLVTLAVGLVGSGLCALTVYLALITEQRAREVQVVNEHLAAEMTERYAAEAARQESEQRFRTLVEGSIQGIVIHRDGIPLFANQAYADIFGYARPADVLQMDHAILQMVAPHEHARLLDYLRTRLPGEETSTPSEFQGVRQDGSLLWVAAVANMVNWEGTPAIQVAMMDITERKQAQEAMRQQWEWLTGTLASIGDGVITTDNRAAITFLNPVAEGLTGWSTPEALGHPLGEVLRLIDASTRQPVDLQSSQMMRQQCVVNVVRQAILLTRDGREVMIADSAAPILSGHGELHGVVMMFRDISKQLRLEEEVLRARKIESVGILAGGIAHDFNNLLTGIMGNISLATTLMTPSEHTLHGKIVERLGEAEKACQRATALTQQLLTFAKGGAPVRQTVAIADLLHEVTAFTLRGANIRADFAIAKDLWPVDADAGQMHQVVHNVVLNAVQAMPDGGIIQVQADNLDTPSDLMLPLQPIPYVKIAIRDHGCGIAPEVLPNIFDPYFTTKTDGSGLGLATAHAIVTKHDGHMTVTSRVGEGTAFYIYLPASERAMKPEQVPSTALVASSGRILVMDDDELIRDLLSEMLSSMGYEIDCVRDGTEAVAVYQQAQATGRAFAAAILDITIPGGMGGLETIAQLWQIDPQVKAIISSGYANNSVMADFQAYGFSGMVAKPYTVQKLHDVLQGVMRA